MTENELTLYNLCTSLDNIGCIDPRGYGVCHLLYSSARKNQAEPLTLAAAEKLISSIHKNDFVFLITGFVLYPFNKAETDGIVSSVFLAKAIIQAFGAKPVIVCPKEAVQAIEAITEYLQTDNGIIIKEFSKDKIIAEKQSETMINEFRPSAVISVEAPGSNNSGIYHNASGIDVSSLEAKSDILFKELVSQGVPSIAVGDLGNEIGMGKIKSEIKKHIPYAGENECSCPCPDGIAAESAAECIITSTVSDWGCFGLICALSYIMNLPEILPDIHDYREALELSVNNGLIDMRGEHICAVDGLSEEINSAVLNLMRECVLNTFRHRGLCKNSFDRVIEKNFN